MDVVSKNYIMIALDEDIDTSIKLPPSVINRIKNYISQVSPKNKR